MQSHQHEPHPASCGRSFRELAEMPGQKNRRWTVVATAAAAAAAAASLLLVIRCYLREIIYWELSLLHKGKQSHYVVRRFRIIVAL